MEIEIENSRENPLMGRERHSLRITHEGETTPSRDKIMKKFAAENDLDPEKMEIESIKTAYGSGVSKTEIKVYDEKVRTVEEEEDSGAEEESEETEETEEESED